MVDDVLRLRATVVSDQALAEIRKIGREIGLMPQRGQPAVKGLSATFDQLGKSVKAVGNEIVTIVPQLSGLGLGAAGAGAAIAAIVSTMNSAAKRVVELKYASKELGMSERDIRAWGSAAEKAGISAQSMQQGLESFKKTTDGLKYNIGGARDELYAMGAGPIVQRMQAATTQAEKMKVAFKFKDELMKDDPSGFKARMFFDQIGLGADKARLSFEAWERAQARLKPITDEDAARAQAYADALVDLGDAWDHFITKTGAGLFPRLTNEIEDIQKLLGYLEKFDQWVDGWIGKTNNPNADLMGRIVSKMLGTSGAAPGPGPRATPAPEPGTTFNERFPDFGTFGAPNALKQNRSQLLQRGSSLYHPSAYSDGFGNGGGLSEGSRMVKDGVFAALVEFQSYVQTGGGAAGGGSGFQQTTFGGSAGAAAARAPGAAGFGGGGYSNLGNGGGGGAGSIGADQTSGQVPGGPQPGGPGGNAQLNDESGKPIDAQTMKQAESLGRSGDTAGLQRLFAQKGYRMSGPACGIVASAYVKSAGFKPPPGGAIATNWRDWGQATGAGDINKEGRPFGSMIGTYRDRRYGGALGTPLAKGQTGGHVMNIVPGTYDPKTGTAMFADQYGVRRRSLKGMDLRYAGDEAVQAAQAGPSGAGGTAEDRKTVKGSVFGSTHGWNDPSEPRGRKTASGVSNELPGIALPSRSGLGKMHEIVGPDGKTYQFRQTDIGPAKSTGRGIDFTSSAAAAMGYNRKNFPTDAQFSYRRIDEATDTSRTAGTKAEGSVNVAIESNGTAAKATAKSNGDLWQKTTIENYKQMQPTSSPAGRIAEGHAAFGGS
ncbi:hypothetical protein J4G48_0014660 [Bradyrhizobium barranii subsp. apii]|uniref:hypothetical protein n=1 Tax=Bradyrhizobium barranii TaxID=2992140 RepID=UPI001AA12103|nr:hypothetical protein [Bradyrhizobium barranii]UPT99210.1 hypothetical protein J4G48_0014660 [Bradyrhizobium barranii subsp. apii]